MKPAVAALAVATALCLCSAAAAKETYAITVNFRGGGLVRDDHGYLRDARAFLYDINGGGGGGAFEAGVELVPRLSLHASLAGYSATATRGDQKLTVSSSMWLFHARFAFLRQWWKTADGLVMTQLQGSLGAGGYLMRDRYEDAARPDSAIVHTDQAGGWRVGADWSIYWRSLGFVAGYAYHHSAAYVADRLGDSVRAGGHEITAGLSLRF
jgi:hypothetical protein